MELGGLGWIFAVNLIVWTGLFVYLLRLGRRIAQLESTSGKPEENER
ncbi:MAG TPA: CcmD family protein [Thermoanaerobaculia bacterium]|nr:CcmD family protein [Thermoanaerobaculia bacterium]